MTKSVIATGGKRSCSAPLETQEPQTFLGKIYKAPGCGQRDAKALHLSLAEITDLVGAAHSFLPQNSGVLLIAGLDLPQPVSKLGRIMEFLMLQVSALHSTVQANFQYPALYSKSSDGK